MKMIEDEELITIDYRVELITHLGNGSVIIDSVTTIDFEDFNNALNYITTVAENYHKDMIKENPNEEFNIVTDIVENESAYVSIYKGVVPVSNYGIKPLKIYRNYSEYRSFKIVLDDNFIYTIYTNDDRPITEKNTIDECIMYIDYLLYNSINFIDSTFDTIEGSKLWLPKQKSNIELRKKTTLLMS